MDAARLDRLASVERGEGDEPPRLEPVCHRLRPRLQLRPAGIRNARPRRPPISPRHIAWDPGALPVAERLATALDATLVPVLHQAPRRRLQPAARRARPHPRRSARPRKSRAISASARTSAKGALRSRTRPFHDAIDDVIAERLRAGRSVWLVSVHSFTPVYKTGARVPCRSASSMTTTRDLPVRMIEALPRQTARDRRRQPALFAGRPRLLHHRAACAIARPALCDDRDPQRRDH